LPSSTGVKYILKGFILKRFILKNMDISSMLQSFFGSIKDFCCGLTGLIIVVLGIVIVLYLNKKKINKKRYLFKK